MRPSLLLAWGNPYNFDGAMVPLIPRLAQAYEVYVMLVDFHLQARVTGQLESWREAGTIKGYSIVPEYSDTWRLHWFMSREVRRLRAMRFDYLVSLSMMQVWERYLAACALPTTSPRICFFTHLTNLLENEALARALLDGTSFQETQEVRNGAAAKGTSATRTVRRPLARRIVSSLVRRSSWRHLLDRYVLPGLFVGRTFPYELYDRLTQLGTSQFDAAVFLDPVEARTYGALYGNARTYVAQHPAHGNCRCLLHAGDRTAILSPLSGTIGADSLPETVLKLYERDFRTALDQSKAREIHLRPHPRESGRWPWQLARFLEGRGIAARVTISDRPIREIICEYAGVVGFASAALRDARACCDYAFVVGLTGVSRTLFPNPKFIFGDGHGIAWVEQDGSHPPDAFARRRYEPLPYPALPKLLEQIHRPKRLPSQSFVRTAR